MTEKLKENFPQIFPSVSVWGMGDILGFLLSLIVRKRDRETMRYFKERGRKMSYDKDREIR